MLTLHHPNALLNELNWLDDIIKARFNAAETETNAVFPPPPALTKTSPYHAQIHALRLTPEARLILILALCPHLAPELLDSLLLQNQNTGQRFTEFGGYTGQLHNGLLPTAETALFLLAGTDRARRFAMRPLLAPEHPLYKNLLLTLDHTNLDEPEATAALRPTSTGLHLLLTGVAEPPLARPDFPAARITTHLDWQDLVLDPTTERQVNQLGLWLRHGQTLLHEWGLSRRLKPGYRCLFYGPPGTGKTLTAALLGKRHELPVYRVDLSRVISKWVGETEKNLATLFDHAQHANWILFFDEAEALFGQRSESHNANDRAANQQISYLLQRLEDFPGLVILATNQRAHMDDAFNRRFQASIRFPMPDAAARLRLWHENFANPGLHINADVDFNLLAATYELTGGAIINVLRYAALMAADQPTQSISVKDIMDGIRLELHKDGQYLQR